MTVYLVNIALTAVLALVGGARVGMGREPKERISLLAVFLILIVWTAVYALRGTSVGADTSGYYYFYKQVAVAHQTLPQYLADGGDLVFEVLRYSCAKLTGGNWTVFCVLAGILTYLPVLLAIRKESGEYFAAGVLLYIFAFQYYFGFNGTRQAIAISLTFFAYVYFFQEKKYVPYALLILLAYGFHSTAPVVVAFHLLSRMRLGNKAVWLVAGALFISTFAFGSLWSAIINALDALGNDALVRKYSDVDSFSGSGILRVLVVCAPLLLAIWQRKNIDRSWPRDIDPFLIFALFDAVLMVGSMHNWLMARIASYLDIYLVFYVPALRYAFGERTKTHMAFLIGSLYFLYMVALLLHGESNLLPYTFFAM